MQKAQNISILFICILIFLFSCIPIKRIYYLRDNKKDTINNYNAPIPPIYIIRPGDLLFIKIYTIDEKLSSLFNPIQTNLSGGINEQSAISLYSYLVNDSGNVIIPLLGKINLNNLSIEQAQEKIGSIVLNYVESADVIVKLLSFKVTFLGEFNKPGIYSVYNGKLNILEAIGMAGDISALGNKSKLMIIRQSENNKVYYIDLTDRALLYTNNYYLKPNDILYAEPLKIKRQSSQLSTISTISGILTSLVNIIFLINYFK